MAYNITTEANADLKAIGRYTKRHWGKAQRDAYLKELYGAFDDLARKRILGRSCDEIKAGYKKYHLGKHYIFYYELESNLIRIVRVLHERMNLEMHL